MDLSHGSTKKKKDSQKTNRTYQSCCNLESQNFLPKPAVKQFPRFQGASLSGANIDIFLIQVSSPVKSTSDNKNPSWPASQRSHTTPPQPTFSPQVALQPMQLHPFSITMPIMVPTTHLPWSKDPLPPPFCSQQYQPCAFPNRELEQAGSLWWEDRWSPEPNLPNKHSHPFSAPAHPNAFSTCWPQLELQQDLSPEQPLCLWLPPTSQRNGSFGLVLISSWGGFRAQVTYFQGLFPNHIHLIKQSGYTAPPLSFPGSVKENGQNCLFWWIQPWMRVN